MENTLYFGDNLDILRAYIPDESVDLIYLDPPFNSKGAYNLLYSDERGDAPASKQVFEDSWAWNTRTAKIYEEEILSGNMPDNVRRTLQAFGHLLGTSPMMAYITMMTPRLIELRRVLKPTGSLYLQCDSTASHYLKIVVRHEVALIRVGGASEASTQASVQCLFPLPHASLVTAGCEAGGSRPRVRQSRRHNHRQGKDRTGERK